MIPDAASAKDGGWEKQRVQVAYYNGNQYKHQPIILPPDELAQLRRAATRKGMSMADLVRTAVAALAQAMAPVQDDDRSTLVGQLADELGVSKSDLAGDLRLESRAFRSDLERLAAVADISMSRAARWALRVYLESG
jgi:hypothetical protein